MQQRNENHNSRGDELDRLLDGALKQYGAVQPREGLEGRILARLRSQSAEPASHAWWRWVTAATAVAALAVIISMASGPHAKPQPRVAQHPPASPAVPKLGSTSEPRPAIHPPKHRWHAARDAQVAKALPKLDQFPSPQPLTEAERRLAAYVGQHYDEAVLIARAREQYRIQDEAEQSQVNRPNHTR